MSTIIGIDPGKTGGLSLWVGGVYETTKPIPIIKGKSKSEYDIRNFVDLLTDWDSFMSPPFVYVEKVHAMPKQGVSSCFTFGEGYGIIKGVLSAMGLNYELVTPQRWTKTVCMDLPGTDNKQRVKVLMSQKFPQVKIPQYLYDAFLIGYWGTLQGR